MKKLVPWYTKKLSLGIIAVAFCFYSISQPSSNTAIWNKLKSVENDTTLSYDQKLQQVLLLKKEFEDQKLTRDSVYARILHRIGSLEYFSNNQIATKNAIQFTHAAIILNSAGKKDNAPAFCVNSYTNLAMYYESLHLYNLAARYYDSAIILKKQFDVPAIPEITLLYVKAYMIYLTGDYQKATEVFNVAISKAKLDSDTSLLISLLNQRAQSNLMGEQTEQALKDVNLAESLSKQFEVETETINIMIIKARILARKKDFSTALSLFRNGIKARIQTNYDSQISDDYTDLGNFYLNDLQNYAKAKDCYFNAVKYALRAQDFEILSKCHINLEQFSLKQHNYTEAEHYLIEAIRDLEPTAGTDILINPSAAQLSSIGNKELILAIMGNKTELLLIRFLQTKSKNYLSACLETAMLTDTLITKSRQEQSGEQSMLYWRNWTREFFTHAMEACYLAHETNLAFYFMEKSRAALLNDKLSELQASSQLPATEVQKEQGFQITVISEQQKLASLKSNESGYEIQQLKFLQAKADLEHYIKSLEKRYPAYYQSKYADEVPSLNVLQKRLLENKQSFIHYFMNDTVTYILGITASGTKLLKLQKDDFSAGSLVNFLQLCSNEPTVKSQFLSFASLSYSLYKLLFQPLKIPEGRVVICPDNFLIPFEALCTDTGANNFLIKDYVFSYVYSARYLLKKYNTYNAKGDFIGFAPVSFKAYRNVADLNESGNALKQSATHYNNSKLLINNDATRHNFLSAASGYTIVNVFSHARADTAENDPMLFMHDSVIYLSELQLLHNPATKLVVLSACETNVGRNATGEGIFSLARGFATAGIPSVAATLWKADEQTIYTISEKFHAYLSQGMAKDEALQKAKLYFIQNGDNEKPFPYYWANIILVGNEEPVKLSENHYTWWWVAAIIFITAVILLMARFLKKRQQKFLI